VAKERDSIALELTINGEYVLSGKREKSTTLRLLIIIRRFENENKKNRTNSPW
jgi:hypothetical protein